MTEAPRPANEPERLRVLRELLVLDSPPEAMFDRIAQLASDVCGAPIALISLVDDERQWFKANVGLPGVAQTPRSLAFCAHTILQDDVFEVADATHDSRFADNPLVTDEPRIRFYAGAPLVAEGGAHIGSLCVIDHHARRLDDAQLHMLRSLAALVCDALTMRRDLIDKSLAVRSRHEQALQESETHYRAIVEEQLEMISLAQPDGTLSYVNPAYAAPFKCRPAEMIGRSLFDFIEPADREAVGAQLRDVLLTGQSRSGENRMTMHDGEVRWVAWTNGVHRDANGEVRLHSVGRDVSARKQAEQALRASDSLLRRTGRVAGVGGWQVDLRSGAVSWSDETRRIHEVAPDYEPTVEQGIAFYAPEARPVIQAAVQAGIDRGESWDLELPFVTAKQRQLWVRAAGEAEFEDGRAVRLVGAFQDITERKRLEHDVASQAATLRLVTEAIPATVAVIGSDLRYRFANSAFEQACGLVRDRIVGRSAREVLGDDEFERRKPWIVRALAGEPVVFELDYPSREGVTHRSINYVPLRLATGEIDGFVVVGQDITAQRREALRLIELSQCDPLTGLLNRAGFEQILQRHVDDGAGPSLAVLYIDLDHFKPVNDVHGHAAGDQILKLFGQRLAKLVRPTDAVARLGGDEFALALVGAREASNAQMVADKVLAAAHAPFKLGELTLSIGASVGAAFGVDPARGWADLVERADAKLLAAKGAGKGRHMGTDVR